MEDFGKNRGVCSIESFSDQEKLPQTHIIPVDWDVSCKVSGSQADAELSPVHNPAAKWLNLKQNAKSSDQKPNKGGLV